jgi:hypothetical protein
MAIAAAPAAKAHAATNVTVATGFMPDVSNTFAEQADVR